MPRQMTSAQAASRASGNPDTSRRGVSSPDPARLERAATPTCDGQGAPLPGRCALGGLQVSVWVARVAARGSSEHPDLAADRASSLSGGRATHRRSCAR